MADAAKEKVARPFTAFNFVVSLYLPGQSDALCSAAFSECDGLEMNLAPKTIREGGNNNQPIHLLGPVSYGQLTLKRGMSETFDMWDWFENVTQMGQVGLMASGEVVMLASDGVTEQARFTEDRMTGNPRCPRLSRRVGISSCCPWPTVGAR